MAASVASMTSQNLHGTAPGTSGPASVMTSRDGTLKRSLTMTSRERTDIDAPHSLSAIKTPTKDASRDFVQSLLSKSRATSRASVSAPSRQSNSTLFLPQPFGFHAKTAHDAKEALLLTRSANFRLQPAPKDDDIWRRPCPDFRPQVYAPKPPKRNSREAMQPWRYASQSETEAPVKRKAELQLPRILQPPAADGDADFMTSFHIMDPWEAKIEFCKDGKYPAGHYVMPKPHDFRGYPPIQSLGLPEFEAFEEHDPYGLAFKSRRLDIIGNMMGKDPTERDITGRQMAPPLPAQPKYEARLVLPKDQWPSKYAAYSRFRLPNRSPHSALLSRIEDSLTSKWSKEKMAATLSKADTLLRHKTELKEAREKEDSSRFEQDGWISTDNTTFTEETTSVKD